MKYCVSIIQIEIIPYLHFAIGDTNLATMQTFEVGVTVTAAAASDGQQRGSAAYIGS
jgi:hypothetical protein